jgi:hypothetical protein
MERSQAVLAYTAGHARSRFSCLSCFAPCLACPPVPELTYPSPVRVVWFILTNKRREHGWRLVTAWRKVGGLRHLRVLVLSVDAELSQFVDRRSPPADRLESERQRQRHPVRFYGAACRRAGRGNAQGRLDCEADGFESADELANVLRIDRSFGRCDVDDDASSVSAWRH